MAGLTKEQRAARQAAIQRVPVGAGNKLSFEGLDPDYHYRVVNDRPGRVAMFLKAGYEFSTEGVRAVNDVSETAQLDSRTALDLGGGDKGYLMKIRNEFYNEDQATKIDKVKDIERAMKRKPTRDNPYGGLTDE